MKLGIIIPLKSKMVSKNWSLTCENLKNTLESILSQKNKGFRTIIVGHEKPEFMDDVRYKSSSIDFVKLTEFGPPDLSGDRSQNQLLYEKDRCSKILKGVVYLRTSDPEIDYWYPLDADDLIHSHFTKEISKIISNNNVDAIVLEKGYVFYKSSGSFTKENNFSLYCGSSAVVHDSIIENHKALTRSSYKDFLFGQIPHTAMREVLEKRQLAVHVPQKRLVMYCKDHGENISDETRPQKITYAVKRKIKLTIKKIYLTKKIKENFSIG